MAHGSNRVRTGLSPILMATNVLVWISAVIVMGILSYLISINGDGVGSRVIYMEVIVRPLFPFPSPALSANNPPSSPSSPSCSSSPHSS